MLYIRILIIWVSLAILVPSAGVFAQATQAEEDPFACVLETRPLSCLHLFYRMPGWTIDEVASPMDTIRGEAGTSREFFYYELFRDFLPREGRLYWSSDDSSKVQVRATETAIPPWPVGVRAALRFVSPGKATICVEHSGGNSSQRCIIATVRPQVDLWLPFLLPKPTINLPPIRIAKR